MSVPAQNARVLYGLDDKPSFGRGLFLGIQHVLTMFGATVSVPLLLGPAMGFTPDELAILISSVMLASGIATLIQVNFGSRLPIVQGVSFAFLGTFFAIIGAHGHDSMPWIAGAILSGALVEMAVGYFGLIGKLKRLITPVVIGPTIALIGLALFGVGAPMAGLNWWLSGLVIILAFVFSLIMAPRNRFFAMFPILLAVVVTYVVALLASQIGMLQPGAPGYVDFGVVGSSPWFRTPTVGNGGLIFPWGLPKFSFAFFVAVLAAYLASMIESFGDYHSISLISRGSTPTEPEINKGIGAEGIGCFATGLVGGFASTSYTENIALVGLTRIASRYVVNIAGVVLIVIGLFAKFGALVATIPSPIVGGLYCTLFGLIASVGLSALQKADMNSQRNLMIVGFSFFMGLSVPAYFSGVPHLGFEAANLNWGSFQWLANIISTVGSSGMAVAAILGLILDNVIPGSARERGLEEGATATQ